MVPEKPPLSNKSMRSAPNGSLPPIQTNVDVQLLEKISDTYVTKRELEDLLSWRVLAHHDVSQQSTPNDAKFVWYPTSFSAF